MTDLKFYPFNEFNSTMNMAIDEYFLKYGEGVVMRLYVWTPATVTIGKSQKEDRAYNQRI